MRLSVRQSLDDLIASLLPTDWRLVLLHWRDDDQWEVHLFDGQIVWFGFGEQIEDAIKQATSKLGGSFDRTQRLARHQPATASPVLNDILKKLKPKVELGRRV